MTLDMSGAEQLVQDFLRMAEDFRAHDPGLSKELEAKAGEIIRDLGLEMRPPSASAMTIEPSKKALAAIATKERDRDHHVAGPKSELEAGEEQDQLVQILDHQRAILDARDEQHRRQSAEEQDSRSRGWAVFGSWLRPQSA